MNNSILSLEAADRLHPTAEPIRLVIWDLDETFWSGTLTEGGIVQISDNHRIVRLLASRGIISSICSKNDFDTVRTILSAEEMWDYFVLPSIDWTPKGLRIKQLIEDAQLRPASVLFIDDNPINLQEARFYLPDLQILSEQGIGDLIDSPLLKGKADPKLSRLRQYKMLERRKKDEAQAGSDQTAFLRTSAIEVQLVHDFEPEMDRAVELINRTNQLNFTKNRLSEDLEIAKQQIRSMVADAQVQAGLVRVKDNYGDHGFCGIYVIEQRKLVHFAFSCRILGMGVETWLYQQLGRPAITIKGEVLTDLHANIKVDWINQRIGDNGHTDKVPRLAYLVARGGCDLDAICHYLQFSSDLFSGEFNVSRSGFDARRDHSVFLRYAMNGISSDQLAIAEQMGYRPEDFRSSIFDVRGKGVVLLSLLSDTGYALYRHRKTGLEIPFMVPGRSNHREDGRAATAEDLPPHYLSGDHWMPAALEKLAAEFDYLGPVNIEATTEVLRTTLARLPAETTVIIMAGNDRLQSENTEEFYVSQATHDLNSALYAVGKSFSNVNILPFRDFVKSEDEIQSWSHFDRMVYFRIAERIFRLSEAGGADSRSMKHARENDPAFWLRIGKWLLRRAPSRAFYCLQRARELPRDAAADIRDFALALRATSPEMAAAIAEMFDSYHPVGQVTRFDLGHASSREILGRGWSSAEPLGIWMVDDISQISIPARVHSGGPVRFTIQIRPFRGAGIVPPQPLVISAFGRRLFEALLPDETEISFICDVDDASDSLELDLIHLGRAEPATILGTPDHRQLAFFTQSIVIEALVKRSDLDGDQSPV